MYVYIYIYIYIYTYKNTYRYIGGGRARALDAAKARGFHLSLFPTGVCEQKRSFGASFHLPTLQHKFLSSPYLVLRKPIFLHVFFSGGVFFSQTPVPLCADADPCIALPREGSTCEVPRGWMSRVVLVLCHA